MKLTLKRTVTKKECPWLDRDYQAGETVWKYNFHTYGCIGPLGQAVSDEADTTPFFELPSDALEAKP